MHRLRVESVGVAARDGGHARAEAADDDRRRGIGSEKSGVARPEPAYQLDGLDHLAGPHLVALDRLADRALLGGVGRPLTTAGPDPEEQPAARHRLERRRHVGQDAGMAVRYVQHQRPERDPSGRLGEGGQRGPRLRHAGTALPVRVAQVIPRPEPVESRLLGGDRGSAHVAVARAHRNQQQVGLHDHADLDYPLRLGASMRAWTVDADDIRVAEDFDDALLHRTPEIDSFLNLDRDDKFIVIGTKGFGKTLLLKAKRILYQRAGRAACLPTGNLLDKPIGDKIFGKEALAFFAASSLPWSKLWLTAIAATTLKHLGRADGLRVIQKLAGLMADERLVGVIDHFVRLLDFSPSELQRSAADTDGHLLPRLRAVNSPVAIFIDGVDEYFHKHIESRTSHPSVTGPLSPSVWYFAQLGLVEVAYQLRRINHHLKVFAAVRKEAYARLQTTVMSQQYRGSAVDIVYPIESLREIFVNNIRLEKADRMVRPERLRADPVEAFVGRTKITHLYTGDEEDTFDYVCRHTLLRPRDLMTIGERLVALRPEERRNEDRFKETVNLAATEISHEYLTEIAPYVGDLDLERFLRRVPGHILTRAEVEELFRDHNVEGGSGEDRHVFCALYRVGLLGHLHYDWVSGAWVQRFLRPGEGTLGPDGVLPSATHYLVHPVLSDVIGRLNPAYLRRIDRVNIVGYGRSWRETPSGDRAVTARALCVLTGDVHGFGGL